jgi:phosphoribosylanthranilate isomerase
MVHNSSVSGLKVGSPVRVKICGITNVDDMKLACSAGADAIGLVFYPSSKRHVEIEQAALIAEHLPPFVQLVGLFVDASKDYIDQVLAAIPLQLIQFHGDESAQFCQSFNCSYIKAIAMKPGLNPGKLMDLHPEAKGFLLDTFIPGQPGGTGQTFDWELFPKYHKPLILAGGLNADNVKTAIQAVKPYAVDISGGVELTAGKKSAEKLQAFIAHAKQA